MEFIDYIKSLFGSNKNNKKLDDVKSQIAEMQKPTAMPEKPTLPDAPTYDRIEYDAPTDEQLAAAAEAELAAYKQAGQTAVENEHSATRAELETQKQAAAQKTQAQQKAIDLAYDRADKQTSDDALKRGVARSSIAVNRMADLAAARADEQAAVSKAHADAVAALDGQIGGLETKRQQALDAFNISLAAKLTERINALKSDRASKQSEATKYNNSLTEKESDAARDKLKQESALYSEQLKQIEKEHELEKKYGTQSEQRYQAAYALLRDALSDMSPSEARNAVRNDEFFTNNLSQYWYYKLYNEFAR